MTSVFDSPEYRAQLMKDAARDIAKTRGATDAAAVRRAALEDAAKVCDGEHVRASICVGQLAGAAVAADTAATLAHAIRALKAPAPQNPQPRMTATEALSRQRP